jgi:hypothetical protein
MAADQQPIACTLKPGDLRDRLAWIAALNRDALRGHDRTDLTLRLRYAPPRPDKVPAREDGTDANDAGGC